VTRFVVTVDGTEHEVIVDATAGEVTQVVVDGQPLRVRTHADGTALVTLTDSATQTRVVLDPAPRPQHAHAHGRVFEVLPRTRREAAVDAASGAAAGATSDARITAPMPGRVVRVLVAEGDEIERDAPVVIVEAMKMENEVRARGQATVARVLVSAGDTVEAGQLMCELTPAEV
jgi:biotin carboxyl carrier protein